MSGRHPTPADRDQRHRLVGHPGAKALQRKQIMLVERGVLQPLDRTEEQQPVGNRFPVGADYVDLHLVAPGPVTADRRRGGQTTGGQQAGQGVAEQRLDRPAAAGGPAPVDPVPASRPARRVRDAAPRNPCLPPDTIAIDTSNGDTVASATTLTSDFSPKKTYRWPVWGGGTDVSAGTTTVYRTVTAPAAASITVYSTVTVQPTTTVAPGPATTTSSAVPPWSHSRFRRRVRHQRWLHVDQAVIQMNQSIWPSADRSWSPGSRQRPWRSRWGSPRC